MAIFCGLAEPGGGLHLVPRHTSAITEQTAQLILCIHLALFSGFVQPKGPLGHILRHPTTGAIHDPQPILGLGIIELGGTAQLFHGGFINPVTTVTHTPGH